MAKTISLYAPHGLEKSLLSVKSCTMTDLWQKPNADEDFLKSFNVREEYAFKELFIRQFEKCVLFASRTIENKEAAKEIVSDAFARLWDNKGKTFDSILQLVTYSYLCVYFDCLGFRAEGHVLKNDFEELPTLTSEQEIEFEVNAAWSEAFYRRSKQLKKEPFSKN